MPANPTRRKVLSIALGACFLVLLLALATLSAFNSPKLPHPVNLEQIFLFTGLSVVAFLLFIVVLVLLVRNMLKLYADQRSRILGARLRTRMFWGSAGQLCPYCIHVRLQLSADELGRRPVVFAADDTDAR